MTSWTVVDIFGSAENSTFSILLLGFSERRFGLNPGVRFVRQIAHMQLRREFDILAQSITIVAQVPITQNFGFVDAFGSANPLATFGSAKT